MALMPWVDKMVAVPYPMGYDLAIYTWSVGHGTDALGRQEGDGTLSHGL